MHRTRILASGIAAAILVAAMTQGCSADSGGGDTSAGGTGTGGAAGSSGGSAGSTGGSAGSTGGSSGSTGGSGPSTGGSSGSTGGSAGSTGGSAGSTPCGSGISNGTTACTASCTGSVCGLADLGRRDCACTNSVYQCDSCAFPGSESILEPPTAPLDPCESPEATLKGSPCTENERRCQPTDVAHVCACWASEWDCDDKPWE